MGQITTALSGFRTVLGNALSLNNIYLQNENYSATNLEKYIVIFWDSGPKVVNAGGEKCRSLTLILEVYYKSGPDINADYQLAADNFLDEVCDAIEDRTNFDLFQQNASIKFEDITNVQNYPFEIAKPAYYKRIITMNGYIYNVN